jgi:hypothetical protein
VIFLVESWRRSGEFQVSLKSNVVTALPSMAMDWSGAYKQQNARQVRAMM